MAKKRHALTSEPLCYAGAARGLAGLPTWKFLKMTDGKVISAALILEAIADTIASSRACPRRFSPRTETTPAASATPFPLFSEAVYSNLSAPRSRPSCNQSEAGNIRASMLSG